MICVRKRWHGHSQVRYGVLRLIWCCGGWMFSSLAIKLRDSRIVMTHNRKCRPAGRGRRSCCLAPGLQASGLLLSRTRPPSPGGPTHGNARQPVKPSLIIGSFFKLIHPESVKKIFLWRGMKLNDFWDVFSCIGITDFPKLKKSIPISRNAESVKCTCFLLLVKKNV